jgi:hypothetical protein
MYLRKRRVKLLMKQLWSCRSLQITLRVKSCHSLAVFGKKMVKKLAGITWKARLTSGMRWI